MPALRIMVLSAPAGWIADKFGRRRALAGAMTAHALLGMAPIVLRDIHAIVAAKVGDMQPAAKIKAATSAVAAVAAPAWSMRLRGTIATPDAVPV